MEKNKTIEVLSKLSQKTFEDSELKHVFEAETIFGSVLDESIGILLTSNKKADKLILQIGDTKIKLNTDAFDFLIKSVVTLGGMLAAEEKNDFRVKIKEQYLNKGKEDTRVAFCKLKTKAPNKHGVDENLAYITGHTNKLVKDLAGDVPIAISKEDLEFRRKDLLVTAGKALELFTQMCDDFEELVQDGYLLKEEDSDLISKAIEFNASRIEEIGSTEEIERLSEIAIDLLNNTKEAISCHRDAMRVFPEEMQADILSRMLNILERSSVAIKDPEEKVVDLSDYDSLDAYLDSILKKERAETDSKPQTIEEGVMEEVTEANPNDVFDKFMSEMSIDTEDEEEFEAIQEEPQDPIEFTEEEILEEDDVLENEEGPYEDVEDEDLPFGFDSTSSTVADDDEEDEEEDVSVDSDFLKRMSDLESTLTGNFEKLEEEIPTFEKIEKLRVDFGELAAKEYVSSLSQEQREHLVKERLAMKLAASQAIQASTTSNIKEE